MKNLNVLITGASGGIGHELAKTFAENNNNLILIARNISKLKEIRSELLKQNISITIIQKDLTEPGAAYDIYEEMSRRKIRIHVLVNCAGVGVYGDSLECTIQQKSQMLKINIDTLTNLTHLFAKDMVDDKFGRILNIGSISSVMPTPFMSLYAATKAYVLSFSEALNSELIRKGDIAVTTLCPGFTKTNFITEANLGHMETLLNRIALSPSVVAKQGYNALKKKKSVKVVGRLNTLMLIMIRILPRNWVQSLAFHLLRDHSKLKSNPQQNPD
ncbi:SDR family NAD(P)-dependent oxidoreductase [Paenibacillus silviterrae]|uniref:SDR family NAD(P)-dependent oxidoreductase n=1 Tax=Paenibacillus silviterrae TaxID=3242194 RepID=UPI0025430C69|nr:SDR family oxidoreductase [Paenibacillus chinjuensis]